MYKEICLYNKALFRREVIESVFAVFEHDLDGLCVPFEFLQSARKEMQDSKIVSSCIDYPGGFLPTSVRVHAAISAISCGANCIDLVANNNLITKGDEMKKFKNDLVSVSEACKSRSASMRVMLEYKYYDNKKILEIFSAMNEIGIELAFLSTGKLSDDINDYIAIARYASSFCNMDVIYNGIMWNNEHFKKVVDSGVFGVSFKSLKTFNSSVFGVL